MIWKTSRITRKNEKQKVENFLYRVTPLVVELLDASASPCSSPYCGNAHNFSRYPTHKFFPLTLVFFSMDITLVILGYNEIEIV
jgi:hypothetical protein